MEKNILETALSESAAIKTHDIGGKKFALVHGAFVTVDLENFQNSPSRVNESVLVSTEQSFVDYLGKFALPNTLVRFNDSNYVVSAIIDYHTDSFDARWCEHGLQYKCPKSDELIVWIKNNKNKMTQVDFAEFVEDNIKDFQSPSGAELLEMATNFTINRDANFSSGVRLSSGEFQFQFSEENKKGSVTVPEKIEIGIPVFKNGQAYRVQAKLRYRLHSGKLTLWYELIEINSIMDDAFKNVCCFIKENISDGILTISVN
jgi:uncharacterized protein YfdQ (DUF2303 family)